VSKHTALSLLIGLTAGLCGGLAGIGGGVVMIPLFTDIEKLGQHQAHGTSLVALVFTGMMGALTYALHRNLDLMAALLLAGGALWPARVGAKYCSGLPERKLKRVFGLFLVFISVLIMSKPYLTAAIPPPGCLFKTALLLATGALTGFCSGLMGVGGGPIMIAGMVLLAGFDQYTAQGSALLAMVAAGAVGAYTHWRLGNVERRLLPMLIPGILLGTFVGGTLAHFFMEWTLKLIFATVLIWTGLQMIKNSASSGN